MHVLYHEVKGNVSFRSEDNLPLGQWVLMDRVQLSGLGNSWTLQYFRGVLRWDIAAVPLGQDPDGLLGSYSLLNTFLICGPYLVLATELPSCVGLKFQGSDD